MHSYLRKEARTLRPNQILPKWHSVKQSSIELRKSMVEKTQKVSTDPIDFFEQIIGIKPYTYQREFAEMFQNNQFTAARWCRQSGKTYIISALLLWYAVTHPNSSIGIVGPSWRQTKRILSRIVAFTHNLPAGMAFKPQKTQIQFTNGSNIEAYPNNPETIRGPTLNVVYADELNFVANDQELYDAILYTLASTDGKFECSSTPWHNDSIFFKIFNHKDFSEFKTSHVPVQRALSPDGPLKPHIIDRIKTQMGDDPSRWHREMEAEWTEEENLWLTQSLIASCIGTSKNCIEELHTLDADAN